MGTTTHIELDGVGVAFGVGEDVHFDQALCIADRQDVVNVGNPAAVTWDARIGAGVVVAAGANVGAGSRYEGHARLINPHDGPQKLWWLGQHLYGKLEAPLFFCCSELILERFVRNPDFGVGILGTFGQVSRGAALCHLAFQERTAVAGL